MCVLSRKDSIDLLDASTGRKIAFVGWRARIVELTAIKGTVDVNVFVESSA